MPDSVPVEQPVQDALAVTRDGLVYAAAIMRGLMSDPNVTRTTDLTPEIEGCEAGIAALSRVEQALAEQDRTAEGGQELERLQREYDQVSDRGDFLVYRHEWDALVAEIARLREERDAARRMSRHYESIAANAGLL